MIKFHAQKQGYTEVQKSQKEWIIIYLIQKIASEMFFCFKKNLSTFQNFGLRPYKPSVAVAVGKKPSASAVEIRPSVDHCN